MIRIEVLWSLLQFNMSEFCGSTDASSLQWEGLSPQVKKLLAKGNVDLAQANLDKEAQMAEVRNQIAIVR